MFCIYSIISKVKKPVSFSMIVQGIVKPFTLIAMQGVCESVLFGMPNMLRPTACWKLDWEELETNQQNFSALCQKLQHKVND